MYRYYIINPCNKKRSDMEIAGNRIIGFRVFEQPVLIKAVSRFKPDFGYTH